MKLALSIFFLLLLPIQLSGQSDTNLYSLLWEDIEIALDVLSKDSFELVNTTEEEDSRNFHFEKGNMSLALYCYNENRDSIVEIGLTVSPEEEMDLILKNNLKFESSSFAHHKSTILGYDAEVFTDAFGYEIFWIEIKRYNFGVLSIASQPIFELKKETIEEGAKYNPAMDPKVHFRNIALIENSKGHTIDSGMKEKFGDLKLTNSTPNVNEITKIRNAENYVEIKKFLNDEYLIDKKFKSELFNKVMLFQLSVSNESSIYLEPQNIKDGIYASGPSQLEKDLFNISTSSDYVYTILLLDLLLESIRLHE